MGVATCTPYRAVRAKCKVSDNLDRRCTSLLRDNQSHGPALARKSKIRANPPHTATRTAIRKSLSDRFFHESDKKLLHLGTI